MRSYTRQYVLDDSMYREPKQAKLINRKNFHWEQGTKEEKMHAWQEREHGSLLGICLSELNKPQPLEPKSLPVSVKF